MPAVAALKDDWTPEKLNAHRAWRAKMFAPTKPVAPDPLAAKLEVAVDPVRAALEERVREMEADIVSLREEIAAIRAKKSLAEETIEETCLYKLEEIIVIVAKYYRMTARDLKSARRTSNVVLPRHVAMYLCKEITMRSLPEIGRRFGGRDHTTVLSAIRKIEATRLTDAVLCQEVAELESLFNGAD